MKNLMNISHSLTLVRGHSYSTFSNVFFLETAWPIVCQISCGASIWWGNKNLFKQLKPHDQYGRHTHIWLKQTNSSSLEPKSWWPWNLLCSIEYSSTTKCVQMMTLFYGKVKFGPLCFYMGKSKTSDYSETIVDYDIKVGRCSQLNEYMKLWIPKVKVIDWPWSKSLRFNIFKLLFLNNH